MSTNKKPRFIVAIGASAGGINALSELVTHLEKGLDIAVLIVVHLSKVGLGDFLIHRLQKYTSYTCSIPVTGEMIEANHIYLAPPDEHLLVKDGRVVLGDGPEENRWRPSVDVLLRSVAAAYTNRAVGIILTGFLNDGMSGMNAIRRSGGASIVQDPNQAEYPDMPLSVLNSMEVDYVLPLNEMGAAIKRITSEQAVHIEVPPPEDVVKEVAIAETAAINLPEMRTFGEKSLFACPDCGGGLWSVENDITNRYRCHIGHAYTETDLLIKQSESVEATLWVALRMMEERRNLLLKISGDEEDKGLKRLSIDHAQRAKELKVHIDKLKELLFATKKV